jgi:signal peptidase I
VLRLVRRLLEAALAIFVVVVLGLAAAAQAGPLAGYGVYAVRSASMSPAIRVGDLLVEQRVDPEAIAVGDVITLDTGTGATVTHRVATVTPNDAGPVFTTKGDANASPDPVATPSTLVRGRVAWEVPFLGFLLAMVAMPVGVLALLSFGCALLVAIWLAAELEAEGEDAELEALARELSVARAGSS